MFFKKRLSLMQTTAAKEIVIFMIGGTIAMKSSPLGAVPSDDLEESLRGALKTTPQGAVSIRFVPWSSKPSPHVTADDMFALAQDMEKELAELERQRQEALKAAQPALELEPYEADIDFEKFAACDMGAYEF